LIQSYTAFTSKVWQAGSGSGTDPRSILGFVAGLSDPNHSVLLRALLDREHRARNAEEENEGAMHGGSSADASLGIPSPARQLALPGLSASPGAYALAQERLDWVKEETALKFVEFRDKWRKRLAFIQLNPFLKRNQWYAETIGGVAVVGKGTRKESKMLYLQTLHDMASDGERQVSSMSGHLFRMQADLAAVWHRESVTDDRSRLLPVLEEALRPGEAELFKRVRLSLGDLAIETFMDRVNRWDKRVYADEEELFRNIAWPWCHARYRSGFEGFMESFADLAEAVSGAMIKHYEGKWDLFLRGLAPANSSGESIHV
jgi:hypothetical protein